MLADSTQASRALIPFSAIQKRAEEAKGRLVEKQQSTPEKHTKPVVIVEQLPLCADSLRYLPNEIANSGLFNARNRKQPRCDYKMYEIPIIGNARITFRGEELRQDDETVWLQMIHLAKEQPLGNVIEFTPYALCKEIGWSLDGRSYKRLRQCLERMQATALSIYSERLKEGISLSMIPMFKWQNELGEALTKYQVRIAPELVKWFGDTNYTRVEWEQRKDLPDGIATWLHSYYASHSEPFPVKIRTLQKGMGITTVSFKSVNQSIRYALDELKRVEFLEDWKITGDRVHVKRRR